MVTAPTSPLLDRPDASMSTREVIERVTYLRSMHGPTLKARSRTRDIMNGGAEAVIALLGEKMSSMSEMTPVPPLLVSGLTKLAQKIGGSVPDLKVPPYGYEDSKAARANAEKRERIAASYDDGAAMELQLPQVARWLLGYGFSTWIIRDGMDADGSLYPEAELRDPFDCYPGPWSVNQQPSELAVLYRAPVEVLEQQYGPQIGEMVRRKYPRLGNAVLLPSRGKGSWKSPSDGGVVVAEYYYSDGTFVVLPDIEVTLDFIPNPIAPRNRFVVLKRFNFDRLSGAYEHVIALMAMMAKIDILQYIFMEDAVMTETNVYGDALDGSKYQRGRRAVNRFAQGTRVEKPIANMPYQVFQLVDRIERRLRIGASYPVSDDSQAPVSYLTGRGLEKLEEARDTEVREYHKVLRYGLETLDARRLEWDERTSTGSRALVGYRAGEFTAEKYSPAKDIAGRYKTRRIYGWAAGWDEPSKIVAGLQLLAGEVIDLETFRENLDGLQSLQQIDARVKARTAEKSLNQMLLQHATNPMDPMAETKAAMALVEIMQNPHQAEEILVKYFTAEGEEPSLEEQAMLEAAAGPQDPFGGGMPDITTVLSQLPSDGEARGGVQTVGRL